MDLTVGVWMLCHKVLLVEGEGFMIRDRRNEQKKHKSFALGKGAQK